MSFGFDCCCRCCPISDSSKYPEIDVKFPNNFKSGLCTLQDLTNYNTISPSFMSPPGVNVTPLSDAPNPLWCITPSTLLAYGFPANYTGTGLDYWSYTYSSNINCNLTCIPGQNIPWTTFNIWFAVLIAKLAAGTEIIPVFVYNNTVLEVSPKYIIKKNSCTIIIQVQANMQTNISSPDSEDIKNYPAVNSCASLWVLENNDNIALETVYNIPQIYNIGSDIGLPSTCIENFDNGQCINGPPLLTGKIQDGNASVILHAT